MEKYCTTSDVKITVGDKLSPLCAGLTSNVLPEVQKPLKPMNLQIGVSTNSILSRTPGIPKQNANDIPHWYVLRTTYGREKKAYDYLISKNIVAFYPTLKKIKLVDGKRITIEESAFQTFSLLTVQKKNSRILFTTTLTFLSSAFIIVIFTLATRLSRNHWLCQTVR